MNSSPTTGSPGIAPCPSFDRIPNSAEHSVTAALLSLCVHSSLMQIAGQASPAFFHIPPRQMEPAAGKPVLIGQPVRRRFPRPRKRPAPTRRAGHFHVRVSGRYNALYLAVGKVCAQGHPGTPYAALPQPEVRASPPFLPPYLYRFCGGKNTAQRAGTMDEGRG